MAAIDELVGAGWLDEHRAKPNERGWQSSFWATPKLLILGSALNVEPSFASTFRPSILLKDADGTRVDYTPTRQTCRFHNELKLLNAPLAGLQVDLPGADRQGLHLRIGDCCCCPFPETDCAEYSVMDLLTRAGPTGGTKISRNRSEEP